ncbi:MAG: nuclear transport factor 2 family protein [Gemmatimonadales bacterium]
MAEPDRAATAGRKERLRAASEAFFAALNSRNFEAIPYHEQVVFRAPIAPGGRHFPLLGRAALRTIWWPPLEPLLWEARIIAHYYNDDLTAIVTEADIHTRNPRATLRVADRFTVDADGMIVEQENHFDPRDVTSPGWRGA